LEVNMNVDVVPNHGDNTMTVNTQCPPDAVLSDFGLGKLDAASAETVSRHIETCATCRTRVAGISADSFVGRLQKAGGAAQPKRERTYVPGESLVNSANSTDGSSMEDGLPRPSNKEDGLPRPSNKEDGLARPSRSIADARKRDGLGRPPHERDGLGSPSSPAPPELLNHPDYELIKELGQGGMGTVYLAKNRMMGRLEVLKVISKSLLDRPGALERFQQEIRSAAKLAHPNIVAAYSVLRPGDLLVFAMEYVRGQDLSAVVHSRAYLPVTNAAFYIHQVALGLEHAHEKGMVHRDIKPNNLMLAIEGKKHVVKILDFGLAKATSEKVGETGLTKSGQMLGTPDYIAPEQILDPHKADIRADIYSLGCTLYFLLSGQPPFPETSLFEVFKAHHEREAKPLNLVRPDVPVELASVVAKMMAKDPAKRYQTPIEVARALVPFFKPSQSLVAPPPTEAGQSRTTTETEHGTSGVTSAPPIIPPPVPPPMPVAAQIPLHQATPLPADESADLFGVSIDTHHRVRNPRKRRCQSLPPWQKMAAVLAATAAAIVLLGVVLSIHTPRGTILIELSDPNANVTVTVDGNRIDISGLEKPLSLVVGEHNIEITGKGYETITDTFRITNGANAPLLIALHAEELQPRPSTTAASPNNQPAMAKVLSGDPRSIPPDSAEVAMAIQYLRERYVTDLASEKADELSKLAKTMLDRCDATSDALTCYAQMDLAREAAARAGDYATALAAIDMKGKSFRIDALSERITFLSDEASRTHLSGEGIASLIVAALETGFEAWAIDNYEKARGAAEIAHMIAIRSGESQWIYDAKFLTNKTERAAGAYSEVRKSLDLVRVNRSDPAARLVAGKFLCYSKDDWQTGLPLLKGCSDATLSSLANRDLALPVDPDERLALADAWWDLAEKSPADSVPLRQRARLWYMQAISLLKGTRKADIIERIDRRMRLVRGEPAELRIRARVQGDDSLAISADEVSWTSSHWRPIGLTINHLAWQPASENGRTISLPLSLAAQLLPRNVDFTSARLNVNHLDGGCAAFLESKEDGVIVRMEHRPAGDGYFDVSLRFGGSVPMSAGRRATPAVGEWTNLLPHVDPARHRVSGIAMRDGDAIRIGPSTTELPRLMIPLTVCGDYDLRCRLTRNDGQADVILLFPVGDQACSLMLSAFNGTCNFLTVDGHSGVGDWDIANNPTTTKPGALQNGREYSLVLRVRLLDDNQASIEVDLDDKPFVRWSGDRKLIVQKQDWRIHNPAAFGLAAWWLSALFHSVELRLRPGAEATVIY
jgi:serine/threonine protein kinase